MFYRFRLRSGVHEKLVARYKAEKPRTEDEIEVFSEQTFYELRDMTIKQIVEKYSAIHKFNPETLENAKNDVKEEIFEKH